VTPTTPRALATPASLAKAELKAVETTPIDDLSAPLLTLLLQRSTPSELRSLLEVSEACLALLVADDVLLERYGRLPSPTINLKLYTYFSEHPDLVKTAVGPRKILLSTLSLRRMVGELSAVTEASTLLKALPFLIRDVEAKSELRELLWQYLQSPHCRVALQRITNGFPCGRLFKIRRR
jgi:hypothetical protein